MLCRVESSCVVVCRVVLSQVMLLCVVSSPVVLCVVSIGFDSCRFVLSCHVVLCRVKSCHVESSHVLLSQVMSCVMLFVKPANLLNIFVSGIISQMDSSDMTAATLVNSHT